LAEVTGDSEEHQGIGAAQRKRRGIHAGALPTPPRVQTRAVSGCNGEGAFTHTSDSGRNVLIAKRPMKSVGPAVEMSETAGFMKFLVDADTHGVRTRRTTLQNLEPLA
jgi:hypothetical protein